MNDKDFFFLKKKNRNVVVKHRNEKTEENEEKSVLIEGQKIQEIAIEDLGPVERRKIEKFLFLYV